MSVSAAVSAHMIAVDQPLNALATRPLDLLSAEGPARADLIGVDSHGKSSLAVSYAAESRGSTADAVFLAGAKLDRRSEKGTWNVQFHRGPERDDAGLPRDQGLVPSPTTVTVAVPEPATLGLMGIGLLLVTGLMRRARGGLRGFAPIRLIQ